jgi:hypothetical protein
VTHGVGNGDGSETEGAVAGRVVGTYLHGPVLARNPALADLLLRWALAPDDSGLDHGGLDDSGAVAPPLGLSDRAVDALREERFTATGQRGRPGRAGRLRRRSR